MNFRQNIPIILIISAILIILITFVAFICYLKFSTRPHNYIVKYIIPSIIVFIFIILFLILGYVIFRRYKRSNPLRLQRDSLEEMIVHTPMYHSSTVLQRRPISSSLMSTPRVSIVSSGSPSVMFTPITSGRMQYIPPSPVPSDPIVIDRLPLPSRSASSSSHIEYAITPPSTPPKNGVGEKPQRIKLVTKNGVTTTIPLQIDEPSQVSLSQILPPQPVSLPLTSEETSELITSDDEI